MFKVNYFKLGFECVEDRYWALDFGPWSFKGYTFVFQAWSPCFEGSTLVDSLKLWVQIHNFPHEYFSVANGNRLGGLIGKFICVELEEDKPMSWKLFLRVLVEIKIEKPLVSSCFFDLAPGVKRSIQFKSSKEGLLSYFSEIVATIKKEDNGMKASLVLVKIHLLKSKGSTWKTMASIPYMQNTVFE
ncbi:hypothetical protein G4B88_009420 [Cannabis sativa]|uniref:DUF4283 domain-containing protein n=1 Tax=Cannabis sativa TaxID=3483 RepID=A0A7J6GIK4_CANSA|nr:hypothetical protein G4B88_009420 [Cannabis sativa]